MAPKRRSLQRPNWAYKRPVAIGLGMVSAAWVVTVTFLLLLMLA
jgi:hypothetical protein